MKVRYLILLLLLAASPNAAVLRQSAGVTVTVGPFVDFADGKTVLTNNAEFDPNDIVCRLIKDASESTLTLTKTGGDNNINLTGYGMATLTLTASNVNTAGRLTLLFCDATVGGYGTETILPLSKSFTVYPASVYDSLFADDAGVSKFDPASDTVELSPSGLDNIAATEVDGVASTFRDMVVQLWQRFFFKVDATESAIKTYKSDGATVNTTQQVLFEGNAKVVDRAE